MRRILGFTVIGLSGCFSPIAPDEAVTASATEESTSSTSSTTGGGATTAVTDDTGRPSSSSTGGAAGPDDASAGSSTAEGIASSTSGSSGGSSSTGPKEPDPYGQCTPGTKGWQVECPPGNSDLGCAATEDEGSVCLPDCTDAPDSCPSTDGPTPPFCVQLVGGRSACLILCQTDGHCPDGMLCQEFAASSICAWP